MFIEKLKRNDPDLEGFGLTCLFSFLGSICLGCVLLLYLGGLAWRWAFLGMILPPILWIITHFAWGQGTNGRCQPHEEINTLELNNPPSGWITGIMAAPSLERLCSYCGVRPREYPADGKCKQCGASL